jgi:hypothetical protein
MFFQTTLPLVHSKSMLLHIGCTFAWILNESINCLVFKSRQEILRDLEGIVNHLDKRLPTLHYSKDEPRTVPCDYGMLPHWTASTFSFLRLCILYPAIINTSFQ